MSLLTCVCIDDFEIRQLNRVLSLLITASSTTAVNFSQKIDRAWGQAEVDNNLKFPQTCFIQDDVLLLRVPFWEFSEIAGVRKMRSKARLSKPRMLRVVSMLTFKIKSR